VADNDHKDMQVLVNGVGVTPGKKVKLAEHMTKAEIEALIAAKRAAGAAHVPDGDPQA
jgi:hypothetical protein